MKKQSAGFTAILMIIITYLVIRFPLFHVHELKSWPLELAVLGVIVAGFAMFRGNDFIAILTADGYAAGFMIGLMFKENGSNNLTIIWSLVMMAFIILGIIITTIQRKKAIDKIRNRNNQ